MRDNEIRDLVFASIIAALIIVLTFTLWGFFPLFGGFVFVTIIHIPVLIGAIILGKKYGLILGAMFGVCSLILAAMLPSPMNSPFTNPLLSVLPRALFGFMIFPIYVFLGKHIKNRPLNTTLTMIICTFLHTIIVSTIFFFVATTGFYFMAADYPYDGDASAVALVTSLVTMNGVFEIVLAALVGTPVVLALQTMNKKLDEN